MASIRHLRMQCLEQLEAILILSEKINENGILNIPFYSFRHLMLISFLCVLHQAEYTTTRQSLQPLICVVKISRRVALKEA